MSVKERIKIFVEYQKLTVSAFEKSINASNGYVNSISKSIGLDKIELILENYPKLNIEWLLTGKGSMLKSEVNSRLSHNILEKSVDNQGIPLIPIDAMAGFGTGSMQIMEFDTQKYVVPEFAELKADYIIRVQGNSMTPTYNSGDLVACKKLVLSDIFFQWNKVYLLDTEQGALIKRVKKASNNHIMIVSDNTDYEPVELHLSKIHAIAIVLGTIRLD